MRLVMSRSTSDASIVAAARELMDREWGKAAQAVVVSGTVNHDHYASMTDEQLRAEIVRKEALLLGTGYGGNVGGLSIEGTCRKE